MDQQCQFFSTSSMIKKMGCVAIAMAVLLPSISANAAKPTTKYLWPAGAPDAKGTKENDKPTLTVYHADEKNEKKSAVIICPGGGYGHLAMEKEGHKVARWLNKLGVSAFVLKYRHRGTGYGHPTPMHDAQRALRMVRSNAKAWKIDSKKIGILGFSAGGHLASTAATHFDEGDAKAKDPIDQVSCCPDFAILCYPVIMLEGKFAHKGSARKLLGKNPDKKLLQSLCNEKQVTAKTPPTFLFHTTADTGVPPENSIHFYLALRNAKVPAELHIYEKGRHGLGLAGHVPGAASWPKRCEVWMRGRGLLAK